MSLSIVCHWCLAYSGIMLTLAIVILTVLANVVIVVMALQRNPASATHRLLAALSVVTALWTVFNYLALIPNTAPETRLFWVRTVMFATAPYGTIILLLADAFPGPSTNYGRRVVWGLFGYNLITAVLAFSPWMFAQLINTSATNFTLRPGWAIVVYAIGFMGFMGVGFAKLIKKYRASMGLLKTQIWLFLIGLIVSFTLLTLTNFIAVVVFGSIQLTSLGPPFTLVFFVFVMYAIIKHKLLDVGALVVRAVTFTMLLLGVVGVEAGLVWSLTKILPEGIDSVQVAIGGAVAIVMGYDTLRSIFTKLTERVFFRGRYNTEGVLKQLTRVMAEEIEIETLWGRLQKILEREMKVTEIKLEWKVEGRERWGRERLVFDELGEGEQKEQLRQAEVRVVLPLITKDEVVGVITLGDKLSGEIYSVQDLELLEILAPQAAVAIKNAQSYHQIQEFNKTLEERVKERSHELMAAQERELQHTTDLLELKNEFVFMSSHDLATPVAAISGYMSLIRDSKDKLSKEMQNNLAAIGESVERLKSLVNDLLQIARGESGQLRVEMGAIEPAVLGDNVLRRVGVLAKARGVKLDIDLNVAGVKTVTSDGQKLMEILENLLTNAIRYRLSDAEGWVRVSAKKESDKLVITVEDNGFGISIKEQAKVFSKFFRSERREVREQPGTGLGLYVSQMLASALGGEISFRSEEGKGSVFNLSFPLEQKPRKGVK